MAIISSILVKRIEARMKCLWVEKRVLGSSRDQRDSIASNRNVWIQGYQKRPFHAPFEPAVYEAFQRLLHVALSFFENIRVLSTHCFPSSLFSSRCFHSRVRISVSLIRDSHRKSSDASNHAAFFFVVLRVSRSILCIIRNLYKI